MMKTNPMKALLLCGLLALLTGAKGSSEYRRTERYHDQVVVQCELTDNFFERLASLQERDFVDPWGLDEERRLHVRLGAQRWSELQSSLPECSVAIANVEDYMVQAEMQMFSKSSNLRAEAETLESSQGQIQGGWFDDYQNYDNIVKYYNELVGNYKKIAKLTDSIGESAEGRKIPAVHITGADSPKVTVYVQCLIHSREWISGSVCMYIANHFCENYKKDDQVTKILDSAQLVIVPVVNPDGYVHSWTKNRLWRKNRKKTSDPDCPGVDLNRNFNEHWKASAASEPEIVAIQKYFADLKGVVGAIDWRAYSQLILRPYAWTEEASPDDLRLKPIGEKMSADIKSVHGLTYQAVTAYDIYHQVVNGVASDWFYGEQATNTNDGYRAAGYAIELRDTGKYGFFLPANQIIPAGEEVVPAFINFAETLVDDPIKKF